MQPGALGSALSMRFLWTLRVWDQLLTLKTAVVVLTAAPLACVEHGRLCTCMINAAIVRCIDMHKLAMCVVGYVICIYIYTGRYIYICTHLHVYYMYKCVMSTALSRNLHGIMALRSHFQQPES